MIKTSYDAEHNTAIVVLEGDVDAAQARRSFSDLVKVLPQDKKGFKLLADFSAVDTMEPEVEGEIIQAMDFFNAHGVSEIFRILPDPALDLGFDYLSRVHYSKQVRIHTVRSREEAQALLSAHPV